MLAAEQAADRPPDAAAAIAARAIEGAGDATKRVATTAAAAGAREVGEIGQAGGAGEIRGAGKTWGARATGDDRIARRGAVVGAVTRPAAARRSNGSTATAVPPPEPPEPPPPVAPLVGAAALETVGTEAVGAKPLMPALPPMPAGPPLGPFTKELKPETRPPGPALTPIVVATRTGIDNSSALIVLRAAIRRRHSLASVSLLILSYLDAEKGLVRHEFRPIVSVMRTRRAV